MLPRFVAKQDVSVERKTNLTEFPISPTRQKQRSMAMTMTIRFWFPRPPRRHTAEDATDPLEEPVAGEG